MADLSGTNKNPQNKNYSFAKKWSIETEANGFTQIPNILLTCHGNLGLSYAELVTLMQLISYWFEHKSQVYPSITTVANRSSKSYTTSQRHLKSLEKKGFIAAKHVFGEPNRYDLKLCAIKLHQHQNQCVTCLQTSQKRNVTITKSERSYPSNLTKKEYPKTRLKKNNRSRFSSYSPISELVENLRESTSL